MDRGEVERLYRSHGHMVLRRARSILRSEAEAEDLLQEVFAALLKEPAMFERRSAPSTFLYAMTTHRALNRLRDRANRAALVELHLRPPTDERARGETRALLFDLLGRLPEELAAVAVYRFVDEMSHEEIAGVLGCSRRHVGDLIERLQTQVRALVRDEAA